MAGGIKVRELTGAASTPEANYSVIYPKNDGLWYFKDDAGTEHVLVRGATQGEVDARTAGVAVTAGLSRISLGTPVTLSGTTVNFTGIPSGVRRVCVNFESVSTNGSTGFYVRVGHSGGVLSTGYLYGWNRAGGAGDLTGGNETTGFRPPYSAGAGDILHGCVELRLLNASSNLWVAVVAAGHSSATRAGVGGGSISLPGALDRIQLITGNGTDTFDGGSANVTWE